MKVLGIGGGSHGLLGGGGSGYLESKEFSIEPGYEIDITIGKGSKWSFNSKGGGDSKKGGDTVVIVNGNKKLTCKGGGVDGLPYEILNGLPGGSGGNACAFNT